MSNGSCPNCCASSSGNNIGGNGTVRTEKWDFGLATYIGSGPDPTDWIDWGADCASQQDHLLSFPGPGVYTVTLYTQNHCGIDTTTMDIMVTPPPTVEVTSNMTTLCPGEPFQFNTVGWDASPPLTAEDLSFNFTYGNGAYSTTIAMVLYGCARQPILGSKKRAFLFQSFQKNRSQQVGDALSAPSVSVGTRKKKKSSLKKVSRNSQKMKRQNLIAYRKNAIGKRGSGQNRSRSNFDFSLNPLGIPLFGANKLQGQKLPNCYRKLLCQMP